jgi:hypothetical protein
MHPIFATLSHWKAKSRVSEMPRGSAIMRRLDRQARPASSSPFSAKRQQFVVRQAAPQEEERREASSGSSVGCPHQRRPRRGTGSVRARQDGAIAQHATLEAVDMCTFS